MCRVRDHVNGPLSRERAIGRLGDPNRGLTEGPGRLSMSRTVQHAIAEGHRKFDLLRGDEPYKAHWQATPKDTFHVQVIPSRTGAKWRYQAWSSVRGTARWVGQIAHLFS